MSTSVPLLTPLAGKKEVSQTAREKKNPAVRERERDRLGKEIANLGKKGNREVGKEAWNALAHCCI